MEGLTLNQKEQSRLQVLNRLLEGVLDVGEASELLGVNQRQVRRLRAAYREEGASALAHGNRGREPIHKVRQEVRAQVVELGSGRYAGFNHTHLTEELGRHEGIALSRSTVRRILGSAGMKSPRKRRGPKHRVRRERYAQEGILLQSLPRTRYGVDGSSTRLAGRKRAIPDTDRRGRRRDGNDTLCAVRRAGRCAWLLPAHRAGHQGQRHPAGAVQRGAVGRGAQPHPVRQGNEGVGH